MSTEGLVKKELDMVNRDPNNINDGLQVLFEDVFGEPDGAHSPDCVWQTAFKAYECGKDVCYKILAYLCAVPVALCWGCEFACLSFSVVWWVTPEMRAFNICTSIFKNCITSVCQCCMAPIFETCGLCFSKIHVTNG